MDFLCFFPLPTIILIKPLEVNIKDLARKRKRIKHGERKGPNVSGVFLEEVKERK